MIVPADEARQSQQLSQQAVPGGLSHVLDGVFINREQPVEPAFEVLSTTTEARDAR